MFRRRQRPRLIERARRLLWPSIGVRRAAIYWWFRLLRLPGSPYSIAMGVAIGAAVCFTPLVGLQWGLALGLAWLLRASLIAATVGTLVANPWTYPVIWLTLYQVGSVLMRGEQVDLLDVDLTIGYLLDHTWDIFLPMLVGSVPVAPLVAVVVYYPVRALVRRQHSARVRRRLERAERKALSRGA